MIITPAIIPEDYRDLQGKLGRLRSFASKIKMIQIDVCDGKLTKVASWPYKNDHEGIFKKILAQEEGLPLWEDFEFEIDMIVRNPDQEFDKWMDTGASNIVVHHYLGQMERTKSVVKGIEERGGQAVICFDLDVPLEDIFRYEDPSHDYLKNIQLMGIRHDGYQGEPFQNEVIGRIQALKKKFPESMISIDGGVNFDSAPFLAEAGADRLVSGSALFNSGDLGETLDYFESL